MTAEPARGGLAAQRILDTQHTVDTQRIVNVLTGMLRDVTGEDERWAAAVTPASRLEADLGLESVDLAGLGERLRQAYGDQADLAAYLAELEIGQLIALTVGDLAAYVCASGTQG
jgi:acyl carrier protein